MVRDHRDQIVRLHRKLGAVGLANLAEARQVEALEREMHERLNLEARVRRPLEALEVQADDRRQQPYRQPLDQLPTV
jgi:hypothetical protein